MAVAGTVALGRRKYAVGLIWQPSPSGRVAQAAREAAKDIKEPGMSYDYYGVRPGNKSGRLPQFALGQDKIGHRSGMASLAGSLANTLPGSWAGAFKLREGFVLVVVRDDLIAPDGDALIVDEPQARERLMYEINLGGVQQVYAPENWMIPGADGIPLTLLLQSRAECLLRPVSISKRDMIIYGIASLLVLGAAVGGFLYQQELERREAAVRAEQEALERARQAALRGLPGAMVNWYPPPPRVWEDKPTPRDFVAACIEALAQLPAAPLGWERKEITCNGGSVSVGFTRDVGRLSVIPDVFTVDGDGMKAQASVPVEALPARGDQQLWSHLEVSRFVLSQAGSFQLTPLPDDPPPPPPPENPDLPPPPAPPWQKRGIQINFPASPEAFLNQFSDVPGLIIDSVSWSGRSWSVEGVIYENRNILP